MTGRTSPFRTALRIARDPQHRESGQVTAFVVTILAGVLLFTGLVLDGGLALAGKIAAADTAQEAARAATEQLDPARLRTAQPLRLDHRRALQAALRYVQAAGDTGHADIGDDSATVTVTHHQRTQVLSLIGISELTTTATATARAEQGITSPWHRGSRP